MEKKLKIIFFIALVPSILIGLPVDNPYGNFFWHNIPSVDVIFGMISPLVIIGAKNIVALIAKREENFYD